MKRSKKKEAAVITILPYLRWYTFIAGLVFISNLAYSDETQKKDSHQRDKQKTQLIGISFDKNWKTLGLKNKTKTVFIPQDNTLRLESEQAVAFYYYRLRELSRNPHCKWHITFSWRVLEASTSTQQKIKKGDDRPLALHIWVNDPSQFGWFKATLAKWLSIPTPGYMLTYSWGLSSEWQQTFVNPHLPERAYINVRRHQSEIGAQWHKETIDISSELQQYFDRHLMAKKLYLALSADTEDSGGRAISEVKNLQLIANECPSTDEKTK